MENKNEVETHRIEKLSRVSERLLENTTQIEVLVNRQKQTIEQLQSILSSMEKVRQLLVMSQQINRPEEQSLTSAWRHFENIGAILQRVFQLQELLLMETMSKSNLQSSRTLKLQNEVMSLKKKLPI
ncbi:MAG: hypothetical protein ACE5I1_01455 [bacterium]